jgi:TorA maturation chaperone TorD
MGQLQHTQQINFSEARLAWLMEALDELHSAASEGNLAAVAALSEAELKGWLRDLVYVASETLEEMEANSASHMQPRLKLVRKSS